MYCSKLFPWGTFTHIHASNIVTGLPCAFDLSAISTVRRAKPNLAYNKSHGASFNSFLCTCDCRVPHWCFQVLILNLLPSPKNNYSNTFLYNSFFNATSLKKAPNKLYDLFWLTKIIFLCSTLLKHLSINLIVFKLFSCPSSILECTKIKFECKITLWRNKNSMAP